MTPSTMTAIRVHSPERTKPFNIVITVPEAPPVTIARVMAARLSDLNARVMSSEQVHRSVVLEALDTYPEIVDAEGNLIDWYDDPRFPVLAEYVHLFQVAWKRGVKIGSGNDRAWVPVVAKDELCAWVIFERIVGDRVESVTHYRNITMDGLKNVETVLLGASTDHEEWAANLYDLSAAARASLNFRSFIAINVPTDGAGWDAQAKRFMQMFDPFKALLPRQTSFTAAEVRQLILDTLPADCPSAVAMFARRLNARLDATSA